MRFLAYGAALVGSVRSAFALLGIGFIVTAMSYSSGAISGPHYDPVMTFAVMLRTFLGTAHLALDVKKALEYIPAQGFGATLGTIAA